MSGRLFVVGTPIGNLEDISARAVDTLRTVDFIAAEDTRVTVKILNRFEIKTKLTSCHRHSGEYVFESIVQRLADGENCALVTDAGMPCISDPGSELVSLCYERGIPVCVVPGPSAAISALAISNLDSTRFSFEGFLSVTKKQRIAHLEEVRRYPHTMIFYEAPHKLNATLEDMLCYFGDRKISLCRELTKLHEEVIRTTISEAIEFYSQNTPKGEFVLVIEGCTEAPGQQISFEAAVEMIVSAAKSGEKLTDACKTIAKETGYKKSELYSAAMGKTE